MIEVLMNGTNVTLATAGRYCADNVNVSLSGAENVKADNIKKGVVIAGVTGTLESGASSCSDNATGADFIEETFSINAIQKYPYTIPILPSNTRLIAIEFYQDYGESYVSNAESKVIWLFHSDRKLYERFPVYSRMLRPNIDRERTHYGIANCSSWSVFGFESLTQSVSNCISNGVYDNGKLYNSGTWKVRTYYESIE